MIAKAKAISYGINDLRYITGESKHKKSETWLEDCGRNPKSQHSGSKQRVHGGIENHAIVVMGRIQESTCPERLFRI